MLEIVLLKLAQALIYGTLYQHNGVVAKKVPQRMTW